MAEKEQISRRKRGDHGCRRQQLKKEKGSFVVVSEIPICTEGYEEKYKGDVVTIKI